MASPESYGIFANHIGMIFQNWNLLQSEDPDVPSSDNEHFDFSDVFGPNPVQPPSQASPENPKDYDAISDQALKLDKLTLDGTSDRDSSTVGLEDFEVLKLVGQGAFAKVYQVRKRGTGEIYAMKVVRKDIVLERNHANYMNSEREILSKVDHPFIIRLIHSFQTKYRLYLVLEFANGGDLFFQLRRQIHFGENLARIYAAEIVSAVSHLHENGVMHRDLKPENILLRDDGHIMLTDLGLAKQFDKNTRSNSACGTLEYVAPEILLGLNHDKAADWWSMGILLYEMLCGKPPFTGGNSFKIQQKIIKNKLKLPSFFSSEAHSLLKGLLEKDSSKRLGSGPNGSEEVKGHTWFSSIDWKKLEAQEIRPSFVPKVEGRHCVANFDEYLTNTPVVDSPASSPKFGDDPFKGFSYSRPKYPLIERSCS